MAQIRLAGPGLVPCQQLPGASEVADLESLLCQIHLGRVEILAGRQLLNANPADLPKYSDKSSRHRQNQAESKSRDHWFPLTPAPDFLRRAHGSRLDRFI